MSIHTLTPVITEAEAEPGPIPSICKSLRVVVMAVLDRNGVLKDANRGFIDLLPETMPASRLLDLRDLFIRPRFDQLAARRSNRADGEIYSGIINLGDLRGDTVSLKGTIYEHHYDLFLVAEHDLECLRQLNAKLMELNEQLAEKQRELARATRKLHHHRSQSEGALKDREALISLLTNDRNGRDPRK